MGRKTRYTDNFKRKVVGYVRKGNTISATCEKYSCSHSAVSRWLNEFGAITVTKPEGVNRASLAGVALLEARCASLANENTILKQAIGCLCRDN